MQTILITGASGQLGSELRDILSTDGNRTCFFLDRRQLPLEQTMIITDILGMYQPDVIIHAGAYTAVDQVESEAELRSETLAQFVRIAVADFLAEADEEAWAGLISAIRDAPDPGAACIARVTAFRLQREGAQ